MLKPWRTALMDWLETRPEFKSIDVTTCVSGVSTERISAMNDATLTDMLKWTRATCIAVACLAIAVTAQLVYTDLVVSQERASAAAVQAKCEATLTAMHNDVIRARKRAYHERIEKGQDATAQEALTENR